MPTKKTFKIDSFQDMYFDTQRNNSDWKLEPRNQPERTLAPVMRITQTDDIASGKGVTYVNKVKKKQYGFLPNRDVIKYVVENSSASELGSSGQGSGMRETNTMPRVRLAPVRKPQNPNKGHNVEWLDKLSIKSFTINANTVDGLWAVYDGRVRVLPNAKIPHTLWFEDIGMPADGEAFDRITRGYFIIDDDTLKLAVYPAYGNMSEFDDYQNRILDRIGNEDLYEEIRIVRDSYTRVSKSISVNKESAESPLLVPHRDYNDSFFKRVTPGEGHRPFMRHKEPGEGISKTPIHDLSTKPFFETNPKVLKRYKLRTPKKSFNLQAGEPDIFDRAYKDLYKKHIGQLMAEYRDSILRDAAEIWTAKGFKDEEIVLEWDKLSQLLSSASKEQFIEILKSYKRQLAALKTSNSRGLDPSPYYGDTNVYPYKGTGPAMGPSSQLEMLTNPIQIRDTQVHNKQLTRILGDKEGISYSEESLKKSLDELDPDTALQWIGQAGGKVNLLSLLKKLTTNFDITMPQKAMDAINEGYRRWKDVPTSRAKKSFKIVAHENATVQTSSISPELEKFIREFQSTIDPSILCTAEDEEGWISGGLQELLHTTVLYGIKDEDVSTVKEIFQTFDKPLEAEAKDLIHFDNEEEGYSVAVIECSSEGLTELHNLLSEGIPNKHEYDFTPHITIAYLNLGERLELPEDGFGTTPIKWDIGDIEVSQTDDSITKVEKKSFKISRLAYIKKLPGQEKWRVYSESGRNMGTYDSESGAKDRIREIEFFKHKKSFQINAVEYDEYIIEKDEKWDVSEEEAKTIGDELGVDWENISLNQFRIGISIELEHGSIYPETNVIDKDEEVSNDLTAAGSIALVHLKEVSDYYDKLLTHVEAKKSFKITSDEKPDVSDDVYDAFTEKGYAFKNYTLSADQINEAIEHGKDLSLLLKYQDLNDKQRMLTINKAIDKKVALVFIYEEEKTHLSEDQLNALLTALYDKAAQDGTNLQYVIKNFDLDPEKKDKLIMKGLTEGIGLHYLFKSGLLNADQRAFAVKKAIETGFGLLDLLKFERLTDEQKSKIINKAIERGVALIYILRKENVNEDQKKQIFEKALSEGKGYYYLLRRFKLKPDQLKVAINKSKHSIDNLGHIIKFQDLDEAQRSYVETKLANLKEKKRDHREKELERKRKSSSKDLFVVPGKAGFKDLQKFFRDAGNGDIKSMYKFINAKDFDGAKELLEGWSDE